MDLKTIYIMDYDVLRKTKDSIFYNLYAKIPLCFKNKQFDSIEVESIPKEEEIILMRKSGSLMSMRVFKVVYFEWKIFVIVNNTRTDLRLIENEYVESKPIGAVLQLTDNIICIAK